MIYGRGDSSRSDARRNRESIIGAALRALGSDPVASMAVIAAAADVRPSSCRH
jgi:AcrR family transcriptional regulator